MIDLKKQLLDIQKTVGDTVMITIGIRKDSEAVNILKIENVGEAIKQAGDALKEQINQMIQRQGVGMQEGNCGGGCGQGELDEADKLSSAVPDYMG